MDAFVTQLIREKLTSVDTPAEGSIDLKPPVNIIRSNRMLLKLHHGVERENVVIRAQAMHVTLHLAARIMMEFETGGLFLSRDAFFDWEALWESVLSPYERRHNPNVWCAIYVNGVPVFKSALGHSEYMDRLERNAVVLGEGRLYDAMLDNEEEEPRGVADLALRVDHSTQVAMHLQTFAEKLVCRIFYRIKGKYGAFSFAIDGAPTITRLVDALRVAAAFTEQANLKLMSESLATSTVSELRHKVQDAAVQLDYLAQEIAAFEVAYSADYRKITSHLF